MEPIDRYIREGIMDIDKTDDDILLVQGLMNARSWDEFNDWQVKFEKILADYGCKKINAYVTGEAVCIFRSRQAHSVTFEDEKTKSSYSFQWLLTRKHVISDQSYCYPRMSTKYEDIYRISPKCQSLFRSWISQITG